jgi:HEAT repeat
MTPDLSHLLLSLFLGLLQFVVECYYTL